MAKRRFSAAQLRAQREFARRYGGKKQKAASRRKAPGKTNMAKKSRGKARSYLNRARTFGGRYAKPLDGALAGVAVPFAAGVSPTYGPGAAMLGLGMIRGNDALTTLGAMSIATNAVASAKIPGASAMPAGGYL